ncbi:MAG: hypothetical protein ABIO86_04175 [Sphingomonas sp.]
MVYGYAAHVVGLLQRESWLWVIRVLAIECLYEPYPLVAFDMANINLAESVWPIAPSFDVALELIGRDDQ